MTLLWFFESYSDSEYEHGTLFPWFYLNGSLQSSMVYEH